jgi:hypothetical protein
MNTPHSGYTEKPESSLESAAPQHPDSIEPNNNNHLNEKTTNNELAKPLVPDVAATASETTESVHATVESNPRHDGADSANTGLSLPPVDTGKEAWLFLLSAFILNVLVWSMSFGRCFCVHIICSNNVQVSHSATASSKSTTPRTRHSRASVILPLSVPAVWD